MHSNESSDSSRPEKLPQEKSTVSYTETGSISLSPRQNAEEPINIKEFESLHPKISPWPIIIGLGCLVCALLLVIALMHAI